MINGHDFLKGESKVVMEDVGGRYGLRIRWQHTSEGAAFCVWAIVARQPDGLKLALFPHSQKEGELTPDPILSDPYLSGAIRADGRWMFTGNAIGVGPTLLKRLLATQKYLWERAHALMGKRPAMPWKEA